MVTELCQHFYVPRALDALDVLLWFPEKRKERKRKKRKENLDVRKYLRYLNKSDLNLV